MKNVLLQCPTSETFKYDNNETVKVTFASARGDFKYVRLFGLPIEVEDKHVAAVLGRYGKIHQTTRERYGPDTGFPILNGVRGAHIELSKAIPDVVHVQHFQARVAYEGMPTRCFFCSSLDHVKADCPKRASVQGRLKQKSNSSTSYAEALTGGTQLSSASGADELRTEQIEQQVASSGSVSAAAEEETNTSENSNPFEEMAFGGEREATEQNETTENNGEQQSMDEDATWTAARLRDRAKRRKAQAAESPNGSDSSEPERRKVPLLGLAEAQSMANRARIELNAKNSKNRLN